jgi:hypothetical protein
MNDTTAIQESRTPMTPFTWLAGLRRGALALLLALPLAAAAAGPQTFATPEAAVDALLAALKAPDSAAVVALVGDEYKSLVDTGDAAQDAVTRARIASLMETYRLLDPRGEDRRVLLVGPQAWPMAIPLVRKDGVWRFAADEGREELINRRIGGNERNAIHVLHAYLDAQRQYASRDRDGDGVYEYATKIASTPGKFDGLYWPADTAAGEEASPFGPLIAESASYMVGHKQGDPYRGYHFKILTRQGKSAPGGAYNYIINGNMVAGFAMIAYPADFADSGVMSFIVSHNGKIYEKDLGKESTRIGAATTVFDPGPGWKEVVEP